MSDRLQAELELVRSRYPRLEFREVDFWARIPDYPLRRFPKARRPRRR